MRTKACCVAFILFLVSFTPTIQAQESLADTARRLREEKARRTEQQQSQQAPPAKVATSEPAKLVDDGAADETVAAVEKLDPQAYFQAVRALFVKEDFAKLDTVAHYARAHKTRFVGGGWKLSTFYLPMCPHCTRATTQETIDLIERLKRWVTQNPQSVTAQVALANAYYDYAWQIRGNDFADVVNESSWKPFNDRLQMAETALERASQLEEKCPEWYVVMQKVGRNQGSNLAQLRQLVEEAWKFEPMYYYVYDEFAITLQPKWLGEEGDAERFADEIANKIGGKDGAEVYFKIAADLYCLRCDGTQKTFRLMSWKRILDGYSAVKEHYGLSDLQLNQIGFLAVAAKDHPVALKAFMQLGDRWHPAVFDTKEAYEEYREAAEEPPESIKRAWAQEHDSPRDLQYRINALTQFNRLNADAIVKCKDSVKDDSEMFFVMTKVGGTGTPIEQRAWPPTRFSECLLPKLARLHFAPPPSTGYWLFFPINSKFETKRPSGPLYPETDFSGDIAGEDTKDADNTANPIANYRAQVRTLLLQQKFDELERLALSDRVSKAKFPGGVWKLFVFHQGLKQPAKGRWAPDQDWSQHMDALKAWVAMMPDSDNALIALSEAAAFYGARAMSSVPSDTTQQQIQDNFHLAQLALKHASELQTTSPHWDFVNLELMERRNRQQANQLFNEAIAKEPTYYPYYRLHALYQRQEWGGQEGDTTKFAEKVANEAGDADGDIVYFEIATALNVSPNTGHFKFEELAWPRILRGYAAEQAKYGKSLYAANQFACLAMRANREDDGASAFEEIGTQWSGDVWRTKAYFELSRAFVVAPPAIVTLRQVTARNKDLAEGPRYQDQMFHELVPQVAAKMSGCEKQVKAGPLDGIDMFIRLDRDGNVLEYQGWPQSAFAACLAAEVPKLRIKLPAPPAGIEWVRIAQQPILRLPE